MFLFIYFQCIELSRPLKEYNQLLLDIFNVEEKPIGDGKNGLARKFISIIQGVKQQNWNP